MSDAILYLVFFNCYIERVITQNVTYFLFNNLIVYVFIVICLVFWGETWKTEVFACK